MFNKYFERTHIYIVLCFVLTLCLYGFTSIKKLGLYSDDWVPARLYHYNNSKNIGQKIKTLVENYPSVYYRPTQVLLYPLDAVVGDYVGGYAVGMHIVSMVINFLTLVSLFFLFLTIVRKMPLSLLLSVLVFTMPGRTATFFWGSTQVEMISILFFFLVINFHFRSNLSKLLTALVIFIFSTISVLSYEITVFLPLIFVIFFLMRREKRTILNFLASLIAVILVLFYKFYLYSRIFHLEIIKKVSGEDFRLSNLLIKSFAAFRAIITKIEFNSLFEYWGEHFNGVFYVLILFFIIIILVTLIIKSIVPDVKKESLMMLIIGLVIVVGFSISVVPTFSIGSGFDFYGKNSRFTSFPAIGFGLIISSIFYSFLSVLSRSGRLIFYTFISMVVILNFFCIDFERDAYIKSWDIQQHKLKNIDYSGIPLSEEVFIFVSKTKNLYDTDYKVPVFSDYWTLSCALSYYSGNPNLEADFTSFSYSDLGKRLGYKANFWDKKYYPINKIYYLDIGETSPKIVSLKDRIIR